MVPLNFLMTESSRHIELIQITWLLERIRVRNSHKEMNEEEPVGDSHEL